MEKIKHPFKLSRANWIFAVIVIAISAFIFLRKDGVNAYSLGSLTGGIVIAGIVPLIAALFVWLIRGRKEYAGTHTFNIVLALLCFGMIKEIGVISQEKSDSINEITKSVSEYKEKINNDGDAVSAYQEHSANFNEEISKMIRNSSGNEQKVYQNLQRFNSVNSSVMIAWQKAYDSVMEPRILDYSVLNNQKEFEYQIGVLQYYQEQSELYKSHFQNRKSLIEDLNKNIPKENQTLKGVMKGINKKDSVQKPIFRPFIDSHINYSNHLIEIVEFLNANNGKWEYQNDELIFDNSALEKEYSELIQKIVEDENQINEWTDKMIEVM
ncbi:hypothetical protein [Maribacter sp. 2210JD10-5]|uniref:hypothetical protein n=1 Tax=Maribacter sp. 2210JD10-5 TaxID=3386272 RepID=UPI0039BCC6B5